MNKSFRLSFATVYLLSEHLAEVVVDEGVDITLTMVDEYHQFLKQNLRAPFQLLINKENSYSYQADAQMKIADLPEISAMAVVSYKPSTELVTQLLIEMPRENQWNIKIFDDRETALDWLTQEHIKQA